ncbi:amidohydrolase-domain-containing protein [Fomitopsis serialis]|uniref:amidohydrolase-domain-containing protein n=1 Tax=Fomitopsis serialis TaxID=139415 RepID=UPI002007DBC3|nr:amidohydrolase-domain-containing protein [Neoantrodia serialis]KAH9915319.1 amidohydrolase-domain-containing protein [Neoantrodia serialis]
MDTKLLEQDLLELSRTVSSYPAIDNHAHAFLKIENRDAMPFEGLISEATGPALTEDAIHTLACYRATAQLAKLFGLGRDATWEDVKRRRRELEYDQLCRLCMEPTRIQCILIDDGLWIPDMVNDYSWHDRYTGSPTKRIVRIEVVAQDILKDLIDAQVAGTTLTPVSIWQSFEAKLTAQLKSSAADPEVVGFKSVACYRTGLDISVNQDFANLEVGVVQLALRYETTRTMRLSEKAVNDYVVTAALRIAGECGKPVQFHTGLGDNDITLSKSTPALMQPVIKAFPNTKFVLLHSSYPFTQEAGYLAAVYRNVFLDFGEIFPFLSADGQRDVVKQVLELCPTNKIMWSTDGHFWPESYYLGTIQARQVLYEVLEASMRRGELTLTQATSIVKSAFFDTANKVYNLGLLPRTV